MTTDTDPKLTEDLNSTLLTTENASLNSNPAAISSDVDGGGAVTDIQKKQKRAERFGTPVHLSEEEKRNSRAERFGTGSSVKGLDSSKNSEELKKKARAERFGVVQSAPDDEEVKKKARLNRFGTSLVNDSAEEEKKKARALRFSQPDAVPKTNGKGNAEKAAMTGRAVGGS